jgi:hypothetical protein
MGDVDRPRLRSLIVSAFDPKKLRQALRDDAGGAALVSGIEWEDDEDAVADELVTAVEQRGMWAWLRSFLIRERGDRGAEINAIFGATATASSEVPLPVVTFAMTLTEASALPEDVARMLQAELGADVLTRYGATRDDWLPTANGVTVRSLVEKVIDRHNAKNAQKITPQFRSDEFFGNAGSELWIEYGSACVLLVLDPISLFHPGLKDTLLQSGMHAARNAIIAALPVVPPFAVNKLVGDALERHLKKAHAEFAALDPTRELGIGSALALERWLFSICPKAIELALRREPNEDNLDLMRRAMGPGRGLTPRGRA